MALQRKKGDLDVAVGRRAESALVIAVPEAEAAVGALRAALDPSAADGMPAHITLLYPFRDPARLDAALLAELSAFFGQVTAWSYALAAAARFPDVLYLAPEPAGPFQRLITDLAARYPDTPPYRGAFPGSVLPHLTVAHAAEDARVDAVARTVAAFLPIPARAHEAWLMAQDADGRWGRIARFALGGAGGPRTARP